MAFSTQTNGKHDTHGIVEADESTSKRVKETQHRDHEGHLVEKVFNSLSHYNRVHKLVPKLHAMRIRDAKAAVDKEWDMLKNMPA